MNIQQLSQPPDCARHLLPRQYSFALPAPTSGSPVRMLLPLIFAAMHHHLSLAAWCYMAFQPDQHVHSVCVWLVDLQGCR